MSLALWICVLHCSASTPADDLTQRARAYSQRTHVGKFLDDLSFLIADASCDGARKWSRCYTFLNVRLGQLIERRGTKQPSSQEAKMTVGRRNRVPLDRSRQGLTQVSKRDNKEKKKEKGRKEDGRPTVAWLAHSAIIVALLKY